MITLCMQMKRFGNIQSEVFKSISFLSPQNIIDPRTRTSMPSLTDLVTAVPRIYESNVVQLLDNEWRNLDATNLAYILPNCNIVDFYNKIGEITDEEGNFMFKHLCKFIMQILSLPTSNADAERLFSKLTLMKTKTRNRLQLPSINALILVSETVKAQGSCIDFMPTQTMLNIIKESKPI